MKKILHVQVLPKLSGVQRISFEILKSLDDNHFEKNILVGSGPDFKEFKAAFESINVKVIELPGLRREIGFFDFTTLKQIYTLCKREKFDIVHTNSTKPGIIARIAARLAGVKLVIHTVHGIAFHSFESYFKRALYYVLEIFATFFGHKLILVNHYYKKYYSIFRSKTFVIYNGLDFSSLSENASVSRPSNQNDVIEVLFIARLDHQKSPLTLLKAADIIINKHQCKKARFTLVGGGELLEECAKFIKDNHLENHVKLEGWKYDVSKYYATADIFCLPSIYEAFGLVFLEAGYYSLPVVSTTVEGIPEVVLDGKTGLLVPPKNAEKLADALTKLIEDDSLRISYGKNSKEWVKNFTVQKMTDEYLKHYNF